MHIVPGLIHPTPTHIETFTHNFNFDATQLKKLIQKHSGRKLSNLRGKKHINLWTCRAFKKLLLDSFSFVHLNILPVYMYCTTCMPQACRG